MARIKLPQPNLPRVPNKALIFDDWTKGMDLSADGDTRDPESATSIVNMTNRVRGRLMKPEAPSIYCTSSLAGSIRKCEFVYANDTEYILAWISNDRSPTHYHTLEIAEVESALTWTILYDFSTSADDIDDVDWTVTTRDGVSVIYVTYKNDDGTGGMLKVSYKEQVDVCQYVNWTGMSAIGATTTMQPFLRVDEDGNADPFGRYLDRVQLASPDTYDDEFFSIGDLIFVGPLHYGGGSTSDYIDLDSTYSSIEICRVMGITGTDPVYVLELDRPPFPGIESSTSAYVNVAKLALGTISNEYSSEGWYCVDVATPKPNAALLSQVSFEPLETGLGAVDHSDGFSESDLVQYGFSYLLEGGQHSEILQASKVLPLDQDAHEYMQMGIQIPMTSTTSTDEIFYHAYNDDSPYVANPEISGLNIWRRKGTEQEWGYLGTVPRTTEKALSSVDDIQQDGISLFVRNVSSAGSNWNFVTVRESKGLAGRVMFENDEYDAYTELDNSLTYPKWKVAQVFKTPNDDKKRKVFSAKAWFVATNAADEGYLNAYIYAADYAVGTPATPTGSALLTASTQIDVDTIGVGSYSECEFFFPLTGSFLLDSNALYAVVFTYTQVGTADQVHVLYSGTAGDDGNYAVWDDYNDWVGYNYTLTGSISCTEADVIYFGFDDHFVDGGSVLAETSETVMGLLPEDISNTVSGGRITSLGGRTFVGNTYFPSNSDVMDAKRLDDDIVYSIVGCGTHFRSDNILGYRSDSTDRIKDVMVSGANLVILKQHSCAVVSVAGDSEFSWAPKGEFPYGLIDSHLTCNTPHGPCWCSRDGIYIFAEDRPINIARNIRDAYIDGIVNWWEVAIAYEPIHDRLYISFDGTNRAFWFGFDQIERGWKESTWLFSQLMVNDVGQLVGRLSGSSTTFYVVEEEGSDSYSSSEAYWDSGDHTLGTVGEIIKLKGAYVWYSYKRTNTAYDSATIRLDWYIDGTLYGTRYLDISDTPRAAVYERIERIPLSGRGRRVRFKVAAKGGTTPYTTDYIENFEIRKVEIIHKTRRLK